MAIVLEQGGLSIMATASKPKAAAATGFEGATSLVSFPLVCKGWAKVAKRVSARWGVLRWDHRGSEGKLLVKDSPYEMMQFGISCGVSSIVSVPSLGAKTADSSILVCQHDGWDSQIELVNIKSSVTAARQHRLYNKCSRSRFLRVQAAAVAVAPPYLYVMNEATNYVQTHLLATSPTQLAAFGTEGKGDGQFRFRRATWLTAQA